MKTLSACEVDALTKEAGRELAAFLLAVEQIQGNTYVETAGTVWLNAVMDPHLSDPPSASSFRRVTVSAASSLAAALGVSSPGRLRKRKGPRPLGAGHLREGRSKTRHAVIEPAPTSLLTAN